MRVTPRLPTRSPSGARCGALSGVLPGVLSGPLSRALPGALWLPLSLAVALVASGCDLLTVNEIPVVGAIGWPDDLAIQLPDTVAAGTPFTVTIRTGGPNACWRRHRTDVEVRGARATITPRDREPGPGQNCAQVPVEIFHSAEVTFSSAGAAVVEVVGRDGTATFDVVVE